MSTEITLDGVHVTLGDPIVIGEAVGHHWFPQISRFSTGELMATASIVPDARGLLVRAQRVYISDDHGRTWEHRHTVTEAMASIKIPRPNGDVVVVPSRLSPDPPGQWRSFSAPYVRYGDGGKRIEIEAGGMRVDGFPRDIAPSPDEDVLPGTVNTGSAPLRW